MNAGESTEHHRQKMFQMTISEKQYQPIENEWDLIPWRQA